MFLIFTWSSTIIQMIITYITAMYNQDIWLSLFHLEMDKSVQPYDIWWDYLEAFLSEKWKGIIGTEADLPRSGWRLWRRIWQTWICSEIRFMTGVATMQFGDLSWPDALWRSSNGLSGVLNSESKTIWLNNDFQY